MKIRNSDQIELSRETDSFVRTWHGCLGTVSGGTVSLNVPVVSVYDQKFVTDISFQSNLVGASVEILNGTAFMFQMKLPAVGNFNQSFNTPIKTSEGTQLNIKVFGLFGTSSINVNGYSVL